MLLFCCVVGVAAVELEVVDEAEAGGGDFGVAGVAADFEVDFLATAEYEGWDSESFWSGERSSLIFLSEDESEVTCSNADMLKSEKKNPAKCFFC